MKFFRINAWIIIIVLILVTWFFWCTKTVFVCDKANCHITNYNMFNAHISKKIISPDNILGVECINYKRYGSKGSYDEYFIVLLLNNSMYKIPKSFGSDYNSAKSMATYIQKALTINPSNININF